MISLTFLWKNGTNIANGKFQFAELTQKSSNELFFLFYNSIIMV